ncbi:hypothetical protein M0813_04706 [Anaeramoeba flamelloides]|uniref:Uncharacterized protein n=1 Tax=Anaeramoeba flamelloides TaxID=1746091 RepID=A0ABQ8XK73_9EUKA|nr:hypothetical protein M0813_04706 [Anaeramoeba flamelloides]
MLMLFKTKNRLVVDAAINLPLVETGYQLRPCSNCHSTISTNTPGDFIDQYDNLIKKTSNGSQQQYGIEHKLLN